MFDLIKKKRIVIFAACCGGLFAALLYLLDLSWGNMPQWFPLVVMSILLIGWMTYSIRQLWVRQREQTLELHRWNEAWHSIHALVSFDYPLPPSTSFTIAPDVALHIMKDVLQRKPAYIVELGGGLSTLLLAGLVRAYKLPCSIYTVESDGVYMDRLRQELQWQHVEDLVTLIHAPIGEIHISGEQYRWYQIIESMPDSIDLLLVDGPPKVKGSLSRYPALPYFTNKLKKGSVVFLDDAGREDMLQTIRKWKVLFPFITETPIHLSRTISKIEI